MKTSRLKTAAIALLVLINLFLFGALIFTGAFSDEFGSSAQRELRAFLNQRGIGYRNELFLTKKPTLAAVVSDRDYTAEQAMARALLDGADALPEGGGIMRYTSALGVATLRRGGRLELTLYRGCPAFGDQKAAETGVQALFGGMGLSGLSYSVRYEEEIAEDGTDRYAQIVQQYGGLPVYNAGLTLSCLPPEGYSLSGRFLTAPVTSSSRPVTRSTASLISGFVLQAQKHRLDFTVLLRASYGYLLLSSTGDRSVLRPVLCVETDTGSFFLDAETGETLQPDG